MAPADILAPGIAADIFPADDLAADDLRARLEAIVAGEPIDVFVQSSDHRRKHLLIADMDSTIIQQECIDELAAEVGLKDKISAITESAMRGEITFEPALRERVGLLRGLPVASIQSVLDNRIHLTPGAKTLVQTMKANGAYCALVSGGFTIFTSVIAEKVGFDENQANHLHVDGDILAGTVEEPILGKTAKRERLLELMAERKLATADTMAVGDGANDLDMIHLSGLGVAFHAKPKVAAAADVRVDHGDLTALLSLQGYHQSDFVD